MSRSDSHQTPPGGWPQQRPAGDFDPNAWTQGLAGAPRPNPQPQPQPSYQQPPQQGRLPQGPDAYGHQDQGYYYTPEPAQQPRQSAPGHPPQFDPYVPQTNPPRYAAPQQAQPAPVQAHGYAPQAYQSPHGYEQPAPFGRDSLQADPRAPQYDQWAAAPQPDPRSYDLSSYMPPQSRTQPPHGAPDYGHRPAEFGAPQAQPAYSDWGHQTGYAEPQYQGFEHGHQDGALTQQQYDDEAAYEFEEPPRRSKMGLIAGALVGAIVVGAGLTYAYQILLGPAADGPTPVVKSAQGPAKVKPADPGGKQFAHSDSKLLGRLGDGGAASEADATGARKVSTLVVGRDGSIQPPTQPAAVPTPSVSVPVPGMTLVDVEAPAPAAAPQKPLVVTPPAPPAAPVVIARADASPPVIPATTQALAPKPINAAPATPTPKAAPEQVAAPPPSKPKPEKVAALPAESAPAAPKPTGAGYVAVLASVPVSGSSRLDALQQFADLQQRYGNVLSSKTPDVTEANLGEKGRYHRLVVGPPGSRDSANSVCAQLKSAGHTSCWIMAY